MGQIDSYDEQTFLDSDDEHVIQKTGGGLTKKVTNATVAGSVPVGSARSAFQNGSMDFATLGTSFPAVADGTETLDNWIYNKSGTGVHTITQSTDVPSSALFQKSLKIDCTTQDSSFAVTDKYFISQKITGYNFEPYVGQEATVSFWVKAPVTGIYSVAFRNSGYDRSYVATYTVAVANTWQFVNDITLTFDYSGGTWNFEDGTGLEVSWTLGAGTNWRANDSDQWENGNNLYTYQVNALDQTTYDFYITGALLHIGSLALPFQHDVYTDIQADVTTNTANIIIAAPPGVLQDYIGTTAPTGWLICNGSTLGNAASGATYASADYEDLFDLLNTSAWGNPGGAVFATGGTVLVPDLRGMFTRGTGTHGSLLMADGNAYAGPAVGASAYDKFQQHTHSVPIANGSAGTDRSVTTWSDAYETTVQNSGMDTTTSYGVDPTGGSARLGAESSPVTYGVTKIIKY